MPQTRKPVGRDARGENRKRQEVCGYIFDLLGSLETIAAQNKLPVLARFIESAKSQAGEYR